MFKKGKEIIKLRKNSLLKQGKEIFTFNKSLICFKIYISHL